MFARIMQATALGQFPQLPRATLLLQKSVQPQPELEYSSQAPKMWPVSWGNTCSGVQV